MWRYENLLVLDEQYRVDAQDLICARLPNYSAEHSAKLCGGAPNDYCSRCVIDGDNTLIGVMAFSVGRLDTVEIVAFVSTKDKSGIGRFMMDAFLEEVGRRKSAILTYVEPCAQKFFAKFGFDKFIPARSMYEKIISKYVSARLMYRDLLAPIEDPEDPRFAVTQKRMKSLDVGDRLLVLVDGTMNARQAIVQEIDLIKGRVFIHYFFWNHRYDEWIFLHSPRICWDTPLPAEPPKNKGENMVTMEQVKAYNEQEFVVEKKIEMIETVGAWPSEFRNKANVQVRVEGDWVDAVVVGKTKEFCYCKFTYKDNEWFQDFPRNNIRVDGKTALDILIERNAHRRALKKQEKIEAGKKTAPVKRRPKLTIEVSPIKETTRTDSTVTSLSNRTLRKRKRDHIAASPSSSSSPTVDSYSNITCNVCGSENMTEGDHVTCESCNASVHLKCYMIDPQYHDCMQKWHCDFCLQTILSPKGVLSAKCVFCGQSREGCIMAQTLAYKWIHVKCANEIGLEFFPKERRFANFRLASPSSKKHACSVCNIAQGNTCKCLHDSCSAHAHVACVKPTWSMQVDDHAVQIFCPDHRP
jgi:hypothetical protein